MTFSSHSIPYRIHADEGTLRAEVRELFKLARQTLDKAYAPYSEFRVAAATRSQKGRVFTGANQENGAFSMCLCAERVALSNAVHMPQDDHLEYFVIAGGNLDKMQAEFLSPCGACRQVLAETEDRQGHPIRLFFEGKSGEILELTNCKALLPFGFVFSK